MSPIEDPYRIQMVLQRLWRGRASGSRRTRSSCTKDVIVSKLCSVLKRVHYVVGKATRRLGRIVRALLDHRSAAYQNGGST